MSAPSQADLTVQEITLRIDQSQPYTFVFTCKDASLSPVDLTGRTLSAVFKSQVNQHATPIEWVCTVLDQTSNPGKISVVMDNAATSSLMRIAASPGEFGEQVFIGHIQFTDSDPKIIAKLRLEMKQTVSV